VSLVQEQLRRLADELAGQQILLAAANSEVLKAEAEVNEQRARVEQLASAKLAAAEAHVSGTLSRDALTAAQQQCREAANELESLRDLQAGFSSKRARLRDSFTATRTKYCQVAARVAVIAAQHEQSRALDALRVACAAARERYALAKVAARLDSEARGTASEPIPVSGQSDFTRDMLGVIHRHGLTDSFGAAGITEYDEASLTSLDLDEVAQ